MVDKCYLPYINFFPLHSNILCSSDQIYQMVAWYFLILMKLQKVNEVMLHKPL